MQTTEDNSSVAKQVSTGARDCCGWQQVHCATYRVNKPHNRLEIDTDRYAYIVRCMLSIKCCRYMIVFRPKVYPRLSR